MDDVIAFVREFIRIEYEALDAKFNEPDDQAFMARSEEVDRFYSDDLSRSIGRSRGLSPKDLADIKATMAEVLVPRSLFEIRQYRDRKHGDLFRCVLGGTERLPAGTGYAACKFAARADGRLRFVADYAVCAHCHGTGRDGKKRCGRCDFDGWEFVAGISLSTLKEPVASRKLEAPTDPRYAELHGAA